MGWGLAGEALRLDAAFRLLAGHPAPLSWQRRLYERFAAGPDALPEACDIPTGLGKTSVIALWAAALDLNAHADRRLPRRLVYVVDRRAVVDQATEEAERIARQLGPGDAAADAPLSDVDRSEQELARAALRARLRLGPKQRLTVSTLRGQHADNRLWLDDPAAPAIIVGTVDMIGSRLLFSGYGVSHKMRPVHAALLGGDALIVLDEAHLVPPFEALVRQVRDLGVANRGRSGAGPAPLRVMSLSATGRNLGSDATFRLAPDDERDDVVRERLHAAKRLQMEAPVKPDDLADVLAERAWQRGESGRRVIVFCNSRAMAQTVHDVLDGRLKTTAKALGAEALQDELRPCHLQMMVGARRVREREVLAESPAFRRFRPGAKPLRAVHPDLPAFLVCTSAGEVGVDLDAEHMVGDLVAFERMVQRFGRVNRLGKVTGGSLIDVFPALSRVKDDPEVPIEDPQLAAWIAPFRDPAWPAGDDGRRDASPGTLRRLRGDAAFAKVAEEASTPPPLRPALTRPHVEAWSMTALADHPGRALPTPFIRGWLEHDPPQATVIWRRILPIRPDERHEPVPKPVVEFFLAAPPHLSEKLETETSAIVEIMRARAKAMLRQPRGTEEPVLTAASAVAVVLAPDNTAQSILTLGDIGGWRPGQVDDWKRDLAGRTLVLDARFGGLDEAGLLNAKAATRAACIDDDPKRNASLGAADGPDIAAEEQRIDPSAAPATPTEADAMAAEGVPPRILWDESKLQDIGYRVRRAKIRAPAAGGWRVTSSRPVSDEAAEAEDGEEWRVEVFVRERPAEAEPAQSLRPVTLTAHHDHAEQWARRIAARLSLPDRLREVLVRAAAVHDLGKARDLWQIYAGNSRYRLGAEPPLAKFTGRADWHLLRIGEETYRHEFGSVLDILNAPEAHLAGLDEGQRDLLLHLVAAHHGYARPGIAAVDPNHLRERIAAHASDAALRFARLQREWGPWGLAWLETLLRAADMAASKACAGPEAEVGAGTVQRPQDADVASPAAKSGEGAR